MKKLLELQELEKEVRELLRSIELPEDIYICLHRELNNKYSISIYTDYIDITTGRILCYNDIVFEVDNSIDEQTADEIITQIEKVLQ